MNARAHLPVICSLQETRSWDVPNLKLPGDVCFHSRLGLATLVVSDQFFNRKSSWRSKERCTAGLFLDAFLSWPCKLRTATKNWMCMTRSLGMSPKFFGKDDEHGPRQSTSRVSATWSWGCYVQAMATSESSMRCVVRYVGKDNDQGGFTKLMWYEIMQEFNCKVTST